MALDVLDQLQLIEDSEDDIVLLGNEKGCVPLFVSERQLELVSCALNNIYHPIVHEYRKLLDFCEIEDLVLDIHSKKKNGYVSDIKIKNKKIGTYSLDEMIYLIAAYAPELRIEENFLETEDYDIISQTNIPLKRLKKRVEGPTIDFPDAKFVELNMNNIKKESDKNTYLVCFSKDSLKTYFHMPKTELSLKLLETVKQTNGLLISDFKNRDSGCFDSLTDLLKFSKAKVKNAYVYDPQFVHNGVVYPENHANLTCAIELQRKGKSETFVLPDVIGMLYAMELGSVWLREPTITKENPQEPVYFG